MQAAPAAYQTYYARTRVRSWSHAYPLNGTLAAQALTGEALKEFKDMQAATAAELEAKRRNIPKQSATYNLDTVSQHACVCVRVCVVCVFMCVCVCVLCVCACACACACARVRVYVCVCVCDKGSL
jgi:hypothetical protein